MEPAGHGQLVPKKEESMERMNQFFTKFKSENHDYL